MAFYNTTNLKGNELKKARGRAKNQQELVLEFLITNKAQNSYTAHEIWSSSARLRKAPQSSVRRALNSLSSLPRPLVEKTCESRVGGYGMRNMCWRLVK